MDVLRVKTMQEETGCDTERSQGWAIKKAGARASVEIQLWNKACSQGQELEKSDLESWKKVTDNRTATKHQHLSKFSDIDDKKPKLTLLTSAP